MMYLCDSCGDLHNPYEQQIFSVDRYIEPYSCMAGDYYVHDFYFFNCDCGRKIEVKSQDIYNRKSIVKVEEDFIDHRCTLNLK